MFYCSRHAFLDVVRLRTPILFDCSRNMLTNNRNICTQAGKFRKLLDDTGPGSGGCMHQGNSALLLKPNNVRLRASSLARGCSISLRREHDCFRIGRQIRFLQMSGVNGIKIAREECCWNCGKPLTRQSHDITNNRAQDHSHPADAFYCPHKGCGVLQPPYAKDYFKPFDLPVDYDIDTKRLSKIYKKIQQRLHPDKHAKHSQKEQEFADAQSTLVNKAYDVLLKPVPRALYLLELNGLSLEEKDVEVDPNFLMDIMDINEEIAYTSDHSRLQEIFDENRQKMESLVKKISLAFKDQEYLKAKLFIAEIKYFANIEDKIKEKTYLH